MLVLLQKTSDRWAGEHCLRVWQDAVVPRGRSDGYAYGSCAETSTAATTSDAELVRRIVPRLFLSDQRGRVLWGQCVVRQGAWCRLSAPAEILGSVTLEDDHRDLVHAWANLGAELLRLQDRLVWSNGAQHLNISEAAGRPRLLHRYADSAIALAARDRYEPAFALIRTSLEQMVFDWLLFSGRTYRQVEEKVSAETWERWLAARRDREPWTHSIRDWARDKRARVTIIFVGPFDETGQLPESGANFYHYLLETYDPTVGKPVHARATGFASKDDNRKRAKANEAHYRLNLSWSSLKESLLENQLASKRDADLLDLHYTFLSGYVHPISDRTAATYGQRWMPETWFDHYSSELVYLFAIAIGAAELDHFLHSINTKRSLVTLDDENAVVRVIEESLAASSHFWFLGNNANEYDWCRAMNDLVMQHSAASPVDWRTARDIHGPVRIPYPTDPLKRLIGMHSHIVDFVLPHRFMSPWPRSDAVFR